MCHPFSLKIRFPVMCHAGEKRAGDWPVSRMAGQSQTGADDGVKRSGSREGFT